MLVNYSDSKYMAVVTYYPCLDYVCQSLLHMPAIHYYIWLTQLFISISLMRNLLTSSFLVVPSFARQII